VLPGNPDEMTFAGRVAVADPEQAIADEGLGQEILLRLVVHRDQVPADAARIGLCLAVQHLPGGQQITVTVEGMYRIRRTRLRFLDPKGD